MNNLKFFIFIFYWLCVWWVLVRFTFSDSKIFIFFFFHDKKMLASGFYYMRISSLHLCSFGPFRKGFNPTLTLLHLIYFKSISMTSTILLILKTRVNTYWNLPFLIVLACGFCDFDNCKLWFDSFVEMFYSVSMG